ncbi:MAG: sn-glycerol-3-phosphate ABC transporter ATP-binding protein UgpC [Paracoccaceae bacterium]
MPILSVQSLCKAYGNLDILKDISFDIDPGDFLVLVGPSGCGKSTLLNCIGGLIETTSGRIDIDGKDVTALDPAKRDIAMVFQSYALFPNMNVAQNIGFGLEVRKIPAAERTAKINEVAGLLKITDLLARAPAQLSGGQRQRVAMGRALVRDPKLFLFDEPLSNLDAKLRVTMRTEIKRLHQNLNATMIYVTHDQIEAMTLASKILVMKDGVIQQAGTPREIYNQPVNTFVAGFMGAPSMNLIEAQITFKDNAARISVTRADEPPIQLIDHNAPIGLKAYENKTLTIGLRPESLSDAPMRGQQTPQAVNCLLDVVEPAGADTFAVMHLGGTEVTARLHGDIDVQSGARLDIHFDLSKISYFDRDTTQRI